MTAPQVSSSHRVKQRSLQAKLKFAVQVFYLHRRRNGRISKSKEGVWAHWVGAIGA